MTLKLMIGPYVCYQSTHVPKPPQFFLRLLENFRSKYPTQNCWHYLTLNLIFFHNSNVHTLPSVRSTLRFISFYGRPRCGKSARNHFIFMRCTIKFFTTVHHASYRKDKIMLQFWARVGAFFKFYEGQINFKNYSQSHDPLRL